VCKCKIIFFTFEASIQSNLYNNADHINLVTDNEQFGYSKTIEIFELRFMLVKIMRKTGIKISR